MIALRAGLCLSIKCYTRFAAGARARMSGPGDEPVAANRESQRLHGPVIARVIDPDARTGLNLQRRIPGLWPGEDQPFGGEVVAVQPSVDPQRLAEATGAVGAALGIRQRLHGSHQDCGGVTFGTGY